MKRTPGFTATDGTWFPTAAECRAHESASFLSKLAGLTEADIMRAVRREDSELALAFERVGNMISAKRRESGELKRARKTKSDGVAFDAAGKSAAAPTFRAQND